MASENLVSAQQLYRYYGHHCAVHDVGLQLRKGEVLGLLGPNGAGKSSTLQMLSGNLAPSAGRIMINGIDLLDEPRHAKQHVGYLPEQPPLYLDLTVNEFLRYSAQLHRIPQPAIKQAVEQASMRCGLGDVGRRLIGNLSKGYKQRVGIAQAIIHSPRVVILDEPTVGLDPIQIQEIRVLIRQLGEEHSVILSTHILPEVQAVCDRVLIMNKGRIVFDDSLDGFERRHGSASYIVEFKREASLGMLEALDHIDSVEIIGDRRYRLAYSNAEQAPQVIVQAAVSNGWGLQELMPENTTLEQIFVELVYRDEHADLVNNATHEKAGPA